MKLRSELSGGTLTILARVRRYRQRGEGDSMSIGPATGGGTPGSADSIVCAFRTFGRPIHHSPLGAGAWLALLRGGMTVAVVSVQFALDRGERQLWAGQPRQGIVLRSTDAFMIPFSLLWGGFAVFWEASVLSDNAPFPFALFGVPFVLVALYITVGRFFVDARRRSGTTYAVTSERVLISSGILTPTTKSLNLRTLSDITLQEGRDGAGTITFGPSLPFAAFYAGTAWPGVPQTPSFEMIPDAHRVYDIIREAQLDSTRTPVAR
jgi:Bacterial membrane flanked domain.